MVVAQQVPQPHGHLLVATAIAGRCTMLTISKLNRWSINYYIDTATAAEQAAKDLARAGGGLGEYYSESETRTSAWLLAGDTHTTAALVGLTTLSAPAATPTSSWSPVGSMTALPQMARMGAHSGSAVCTGSI
jgi:hypothetical protein